MRSRPCGDGAPALPARRGLPVSLTGPAGVGKTRLALQVATRLASSIAGGVFTVDLGNVLEADQLTDVVADALALGDQRDPAKNTIVDLGRRLARSLGTRAVLIVPENGEHPIVSCAPLIEQLLTALPGLQLLVTSQQVLGLAGEYSYVVPPLSLPDPSDIDAEPADLCAGASRGAHDVRGILASLVDKSMVAGTASNGVHSYRLLVTAFAKSTCPPPCTGSGRTCARR